MSRGSFGRTVARAAASGGGKSYKARPPMLWYVAIALIVIVGVGLIVYSRNEVTSKAAASTAAPTAKDNWYTALGFDVCGTFKPNLPANANLATAGIRTFGDGIVNTNPGAVANSSAFTGAHATLGTFVSTYGQGLALTRSTLALPVPGAKPKSTTSTSTPSKSGATATTSSKTATSSKAGTTTTSSKAAAASSKTTSSTKKSASSSSKASSAFPVTHYSTGQTCKTGTYAGKKAAVEVETWSSPTATGSLFTGDPSTIKLTNGGMITVAFLPPGTTVPAPHSKSTLVQDLGKK